MSNTITLELTHEQAGTIFDVLNVWTQGSEDNVDGMNTDEFAVDVNDATKAVLAKLDEANDKLRAELHIATRTS